jgi:hypothetical protein
MRDALLVERSVPFGFAPKSSETIGIGRDGLCRTLLATWRFKSVSVARYTSPMPPTPTRLRISVKLDAGSGWDRTAESESDTETQRICADQRV